MTFFQAEALDVASDVPWRRMRVPESGGKRDGNPVTSKDGRSVEVEE